MHRKFIATIAAAAIGITSLGATPAAADNDDAARALAALLGIAIIGAVINDSRKDDHVTRDRIYRPHHPIKPRPLPPRVGNRKLLPAQCLRTFRTDHGKINGFGSKCLGKSYRHVNALPRSCAVRFRDQHGYGRGWSAQCLRRNGYQLARH